MRPCKRRAALVRNVARMVAAPDKPLFHVVSVDSMVLAAVVIAIICHALIGLISSLVRR